MLLLGPPAHTPAAHALGTNRAVAVVGTSGAAVTYARGTRVDVRLAVRIGIAALAGLGIGFHAGLIGPGTFLVLTLTADSSGASGRPSSSRWSRILRTNSGSPDVTVTR